MKIAVLSTMLALILCLSRAVPAPEPVRPDTAVWTVTFTDPYGEPVPGCAVNFCTDTFCTTITAGGQGVAVFRGEPGIYYVRVTRVPEGYAFDTSREYWSEIGGGEYFFTVTRRQPPEGT